MPKKAETRASKIYALILLPQRMQLKSSALFYTVSTALYYSCLLASPGVLMLGDRPVTLIIAQVRAQKARVIPSSSRADL